MHKTQSDLDMSFKSFVEVYTADVKSRIKENTWHTKEHIIRTKLLPYFGKRKIAEIQPKDILAWQNEMLNSRDKNGQPYSPVYLKTVHTQLSTIFNHACKFYGLCENPAMKVGNMGKAKSREMLMGDRDKIQFRIVYVLDADTLELMSITDYDTLPDGSEVKAYELRFAYDVDLPYAEEIAAIQAHLDAASDYRSTTFVLDEGTAYEVRYTYITPKGDGCFMPEEITKDGIPYRIDAERSTLTNEAKDNDAILYLDRLDAESAD